MNRWVAATALLLSVVSSRFAWAIPFGTNLIVNGDAESGPSVEPALVAPDVPGWETSSYFTVVSYGTCCGFPKLDDPGPPIRGHNFFSGGPIEGSTRAAQTIDVSDAADVIDTGGR